MNRQSKNVEIKDRQHLISPSNPGRAIGANLDKFTAVPNEALCAVSLAGRDKFTIS